MKKEYKTPFAEKVEFDFSTQIASSSNCTVYVKWFMQDNVCISDEDEKVYDWKGLNS